MLSKNYIITQYRNLNYVIVNTDIQGIVCAYNPSIQPQRVVVICDNRSNYILTKTNTDKLKQIIRESISMPETINAEMLFIILNNWQEMNLIRKNHVHINIHTLGKYHGRISTSLKPEYEILSKILKVQKMAASKNNLRLLTFTNTYRIWATYVIIALTLFMYQYTARNEILWGSSRTAVIDLGEKARLISYMFAHANLFHLMGNMVSLFVIGRLLERKIGAIRLTSIYLLSGIWGAIVSMTYSLDASIYTIGASGAVYGLFGALLAKVLMENKYERDLSLPILAAAIISSLYAGSRLFGTDNLCHVGGLIAGFLIMVILQLCNMIELTAKSICLQAYFNKRIVLRDGM